MHEEEQDLDSTTPQSEEEVSLVPHTVVCQGPLNSDWKRVHKESVHMP